MEKQVWVSRILVLKLRNKNFYDNVLASGGRQLLSLVEKRSIQNPSYTLINNKEPLFNQEKYISDNFNDAIPMFNQNDKFIENLSSATKARKTFRELECSSNLISPRIKIDNDLRDWKQIVEDPNTMAVSPINKNCEYYSVGKDRVYLREISLGNDKFNIK